MKTRHFIPILIALLPVSCASDSNGGKSRESERPAKARKSLSERLNEKNGYKQDSDGNWVPQNDKRSSFEGKGQSAYFKGQYEKKAYKAGEYSKTSFWGNKEYGTQQYSGGTDGSRFQKNSRFDGQGARESGNAAKIPGTYQTDTYATGAAHEAGNKAIGKPVDTETEMRRKLYQAPEIIDWREQRQLSLEQSKGILGR